MRFRRRLLATAFVAMSIVACVGYVHYSTTTQLAVTVNGSNFSFGEVELGGSSTPQTIVISPASGSGDSVDTITSITFSCSDFMVGSGPGSNLNIEVSRRCAVQGSGSEVMTDTKPDRDGTGFEPAPEPQAASCGSFIVKTASFPATFFPKTPGPQSCKVTFGGTFGSLDVNLFGTGKAPNFVLEASPRNVDFGDVRLGLPSRVVRIDVRNAGSMPLSISAVVLGNNTVFDVDGNTGSHQLAVGVTEQLEVTCTPTVEGKVQTTLTINSNAKDGAFVIPLDCNGVDSDLVPAPGSPIDLDTRVGEPVIRPVTVTNSGAATATINSLALMNTEQIQLLDAPAPNLVLAPGENFTIRLRYTATTPFAKSDNGKLRISYDGTEQLELVISSEALETEIGTNPDGVDFGPVCAGTTKEMPVAVFSTKPGGFVVNSISTPDAPFSLTAASGAVQGNHGDELTFMASASPTTAGPASTTVTVTTDAPSQNTRELTLEVTGLPDGVSHSPVEGLDFGTPDLGTTTLFKPAKLTNCSGGDLEIIGAAIEGEAAADFEFVGVADQAEVARTLPSTESIELLVIMRPETPDVRVAKLVVTHSEGKTEIPLTGVGNGMLPEPEDPKGPETYYQCSSGGSGGVLVGLAILGLLIRRRR